MNRKSIYLKLATIFVCTTFLYACSNSTTKTTTETETAVKASIIGNKSIKSVIGKLVTYDKEDYYSDWKNENPNYIELNGTAANLKVQVLR
jgi:hypothetical protein